MPTLPRLSSFSRSTSQHDSRGSTHDRRDHRSSSIQAIPKSLSLRHIDSAPIVTHLGLGSPTTPSPMHSPRRPLTTRSMSTSNAAAHSPGLPSPPSSYRHSHNLDSYGVRPRRPSGPPRPRSAVEWLVERPKDPKDSVDDALDDFRRQVEQLVCRCWREGSTGDEVGHGNLIRRLAELRKYCTDWDELLTTFEDRAVAEALQHERSIGA